MVVKGDCYFGSCYNFVGDAVDVVTGFAGEFVDGAKDVAATVTNGIVDGAQTVWGFISFWD